MYSFSSAGMKTLESREFILFIAASLTPRASAWHVIDTINIHEGMNEYENK